MNIIWQKPFGGISILFTIITFFSTLLGGLFALRFKDKLQLIIGFSAGAVIGVSFFDLLPESLSLGSKGYNSNVITTIVVIGFLIYMVLDRMALLHTRSKESQVAKRRTLEAGSLSVHSFLDGIAIGLAFQISDSIGTLVAVAIIAHDFSDGLNTVSIVLKNKGNRKDAFKWLLVDSITPVLGVISASFFQLSESSFAIVLSLFTGFFFYIGASDLLPESQKGHSSVWTTIMTISGVTLIFLVKYLSNR